MKTLIVGRDPGKGHDPVDGPAAFQRGQAAKRLANLLEMSVNQMHVVFKFTNLSLHPHPGAFSRDDKIWSRIRIEDMIEHGQRVVVLGVEAKNAFVWQWAEERQLFAWHTQKKLHGDESYQLACAPHPSGRNRFWNDPQEYVRAREFFRSIVPL